VYWEVTRACDLACRHCRAQAAPDPDPGELSAAEGLRLLERLAGFGPPLPHLILTGGDPLKRADLFALIAAAGGLGFEISVAPSGTPRLTTEAIVQLKAAGVDTISLSLDGSDAGRHDGLRGMPGCFDRTVQAARACAGVGLPFQGNTLVSAETLDDLEAICGLASDLGATRWSLFFLITVGRGTVLSPISPSECEGLFARLADWMRPGGPMITTTEAPHLRRYAVDHSRRAALGEGAPLEGSLGHAAGVRDGSGIMFISHTGVIYPSGFLPLSAGSVRTEDPVTIYREAGIFRALRRPDLFGGRCGRCEYRDPCGGSRARAYAATGDPLAEDPLCVYESAAP
jgi:radical SAM protein